MRLFYWLILGTLPFLCSCNIKTAPIPLHQTLTVLGKPARLVIDNEYADLYLKLDGCVIHEKWPVPEAQYIVPLNEGNHHLEFLFIVSVKDSDDAGRTVRVKEPRPVDLFFNVESGKEYSMRLSKGQFMEIKRGLVVQYDGWSEEEQAAFPKFMKVSDK